jgi:hypothetical protein
MATWLIGFPGEANMIKSPARNTRRSSGTRLPADACAREVRGSRTPCFSKTYFTYPEQSNPVLG